MRSILILLLIFCLPVSAVYAGSVQCHADMAATRQQQITDENWELHTKQEEIRVYHRNILDSGIHEVLAMTTMKLPAAKLFDTISDYARYPEFMPYVKESAVQPGGNSRQIHVYQKLDFPWPISNRYYTIALTPDTSQAQQGHFAVKWSLAQQAEPTEEEGVQLKINNGYWQFCTTAENSTFVEYYLHTDPGGMLPQWAVNRANAKAVPDVIRALQKRAASATLP